jgi:hypothetical protein
LRQKIQIQTVIREKLPKVIQYKKAPHKMLAKLTLVVNFINILRAAFAPIFFLLKLQSQTATKEKLRKALLYKKVGCK